MKYLNETFLAKYSSLPTPMTTMGEVTYWRTYSRSLWEQGRKEYWWETVARVVEGTFSVLHTHCEQQGSTWNHSRAERTAREMYERIYHFKFTPPGRGLYSMGTEAVQVHGAGVVNNCGFLSTKYLSAEVFAKLMDLSMLGVGVGYDTLGQGILYTPRLPTWYYTIADTRGGWVDSIRVLLNSYLEPDQGPVEFMYGQIRQAGIPIKRFGGISSGPAPLKQLHQSLRQLCESYAGKPIDSEWIVDCANMIGRCVVSGNVRRSAQIALGEPTDMKFLHLKTDSGKVNDYRAFSNNSVIAHIGMDYREVGQLTAQYGEPGYLWLDNCRSYGRMNGQSPTRSDMLVAGTNPCLSPETLVVTDCGIKPIKELVGKTVNVKSHGQWISTSNFRVTGEQATILRVTLHDGSSLRVTPRHTMILESGLRVEASELLLGDRLKISEVETHGDHYEEGAYIKGFMIGDGCLNIRQSKPMLYLYWPKFCCQARLIKSAGELVIDRSKRSDAYITPSFTSGVMRCMMKGLTVRPQLIPWAKEYKDVFPIEVFSWDRYSKLEFIAGVMDADGTASDTKNGFMYQLTSIHKPWLEGFQSLLKTIGVRSTLRMSKAKQITDFPGRGGLYYTQDCWRLTISQIASVKLAKQVTFSRLASFANKEVAYNLKPRFNRVVGITPDGIADQVYCCTIPLTHSFTLACGVEVGQCSEQSLENNELCCLVETYPAHHRSLDDYLHTLKLAYLYAKSVTLLKTGFTETDTIIARNRRIGCSMSGVTQAMQKLGAGEFFRWCSRGYDFLTGLDASYSGWLKVPESIKRTSVKPSGTVSILANASPGIHYPHGEYYLRRIRIQAGSRLLTALDMAGYTIVPDIYGQEKGKENTMVVEFPIHEQNFLKGKQHATMFEQLALAAMMQRYWADNQVSITVHFTEQEAKDIPLALEIYQHHLKSVSFLPYDPHVLYPLAPYEDITKETYAKRMEAIKPVTLPYNCTDGEEVPSGGCDGDTCEKVG